MLSKSVLDHFGFARLPFSKNLSPKDAFPTASYTEALARLEYGIGTEDFLLLTGPVGVGKSVALASLIHSLDPVAYGPIYIRGNNLGEGELYKAILSGLDRDPPRYTQPARRMFFSVVPESSRKPIALIDDAQEMTDAALLSLKSLANFSSDSQSRITFILSAQPEFRARLKLAQYHPLKQRIRLFYHMKPMSLEETCRYIDYHTKAAGNPIPLFSDAAKAEIHRHADGIPRLVNTICYRSLINATVRNQKLIDSADVFLEDLEDAS
jgi:type II secretory pathway predicted ATPase ExeA